MTRPQKPEDDKTESLKKYGALNPHPQKVVEKTFSDSALEFFDPRDLVQVKYEMLRAVEKEGRSVKHASEAFGFSRGTVTVQTGGRDWACKKASWSKIGA
jgi:hypothetical protein